LIRDFHVGKMVCAKNDMRSFFNPTNKENFMKARHLLFIGFTAIVAMAFCQSAFAKERVVFGGGPAGGRPAADECGVFRACVPGPERKNEK